MEWLRRLLPGPKLPERERCTAKGDMHCNHFDIRDCDRERIEVRLDGYRLQPRRTTMIDDKVRLLTTATNAAIEARCMSQSMWCWESIAEKTAAEILGDEWEWTTIHSIGRPPRIAITRHIHHIHRDNSHG